MFKITKYFYGGILCSLIIHMTSMENKFERTAEDYYVQYDVICLKKDSLETTF